MEEVGNITTDFKNNLEHQNWLFLTKPHINLRNPRSSKPTQLFLVFRIDKKQYKIPIKGTKVIPEHWDKKAQQAKVSYMYCEMENKNNLSANNKILEILLAFQKFLFYLCAQKNTPNIKECIAKYFGMTKRTKKKQSLSATLQSGLRKSAMGEASFRQYLHAINLFCEWVNGIIKDSTIEDITEDILFQYKDFLFSQLTKHKYTGEMVSPQNNTVCNDLKRLLTIFNYCNIHTDVFKKVIKSIKQFDQDQNQIYLNDDEINRLCSIKLDGTKDKVRDLFLFQLSIAQRISDVLPLCGKKIDIKDRKFTLYQKKTKIKVTVPVDDIALSILEKYDYVLPVVNYRTIEKNLKDIAEKSKLDDIIECSELRGNKEYKFTVKKWQMIGTHTARRTFITDKLKQNYDAEIIRKITGHKSAAFSKYNRLSSEDAADIFLKDKSTENQRGISSELNQNVNQQHTNELEEARKVLFYLGASAIEVYKDDDIERIKRLIFSFENKITEKCGVDYKKMKELFNSDIPFEEKVKEIQHWLHPNDKN